VEVLVAVIPAEGMAAPDGSWTRPVNEPRTVWAARRAERVRRANRSRSMTRIVYMVIEK
jgi:hypothetical protein